MSVRRWGVVVLVVVVAGYAIRARGAADRNEAAAAAYFVPTVVSGSIQPEPGQVLLLKATNMSEAPLSLRMMLFADEQAIPHTSKDFLAIPGGHTVSYMHEPRVVPATFGKVTIDAPEAVRVSFAPVSGGDPGVMRRVVATVQLVRVSAGSAGGPASLTAVQVPVQHCNFEPRGYVPYTGARWYWNCAPQMFPLAEPWRQPGLTSAPNRFLVN